MKILIRDISRNLFLGPGGTWVKSVADARAFALGTSAVDHIKRNGLTGVDLYCVFRNITFNTTIPITAYEKVVSDNAAILKQPAPSREPAETPPGKRCNIRVLLVEDDPDDAHLVKTALRTELSCEVIVAFTQQIFEAELEHRRPDLIVSDSNVRAFDGMTALKLARKKYPEVPFVFCSGSMSPEKRETALAMGATHWASKEDCFRELMQIVMRLRASQG